MPWPNRALIELLGVEHPIIQAPMAGASTPALAAAVSNAGALGGFGGTDCDPATLREVIRDIRSKTSRPFIINLYLDRTQPHAPAPEREAALKAALAPAHAELGAGEVPDPVDVLGRFERQTAVLIEERVPVVSTHFGAPPPPILRKLQSAGVKVMATATNVAEAVQLQAAGVDAVIAQGGEAGGHRGGGFAASPAPVGIGTMALVPQIVDALFIPVIAAGGIMDGRGIAASFALGASGVQMGTAFVACPEAAVSPAYVQRLLQAGADDAVLTDAFSGRPARLLRNRLIDLLEQHREHRLAFPEQASISRNLRKVAEETDNADFLPLFAGQGVSLTRQLPAAALVERLIAEALAILPPGVTSPPPPGASNVP